MSVRTFIPSEGNSKRKHLADEFSRWIWEQDVHLYATLNFNRKHTINGARHQYGQWLARIDRKFLGRKWYLRGVGRTFAIGIIEHPESYIWESDIHIHAVARLPKPGQRLAYPAQAQLLRSFWDEIQHPGSCDVQEIDGLARLAGYICKDLHKPGHYDNCYIISSEFHNHS